jgi:hypothetical protein
MDPPAAPCPSTLGERPPEDIADRPQAGPIAAGATTGHLPFARPGSRLDERLFRRNRIDHRLLSRPGRLARAALNVMFTAGAGRHAQQVAGSGSRSRFSPDEPGPSVRDAAEVWHRVDPAGDCAGDGENRAHRRRLSTTADLGAASRSGGHRLTTRAAITAALRNRHDAGLSLGADRRTRGATRFLGLLLLRFSVRADVRLVLTVRGVR